MRGCRATTWILEANLATQLKYDRCSSFCAFDRNLFAHLFAPNLSRSPESASAGVE